MRRIVNYGSAHRVAFNVELAAEQISVGLDERGTTYREQVIRKLDSAVSIDRAFSFRNEFVDAFYKLNNPDKEGAPVVASFETRREDFPPNIEDLRIEHVLMYFLHSDAGTYTDGTVDASTIPVENFLFEPERKPK